MLWTTGKKCWSILFIIIKAETFFTHSKPIATTLWCVICRGQTQCNQISNFCRFINNQSVTWYVILKYIYNRFLYCRVEQKIKKDFKLFATLYKLFSLWPNVAVSTIRFLHNVFRKFEEMICSMRIFFALRYLYYLTFLH
jgi:hypothetical protein